MTSASLASPLQALQRWRHQLTVPQFTVVTGLLVILVGTLLLASPLCSTDDVGLWQALFTVTSAITVTGSPAIAVPCGFDSYGRPTGLQLVGKPRGEAALLQAASLFETMMGLHKMLPIDPRPGTVPPS